MVRRAITQPVDAAARGADAKEVLRHVLDNTDDVEGWPRTDYPDRRWRRIDQLARSLLRRGKAELLRRRPVNHQRDRLHCRRTNARRWRRRNLVAGLIVGAAGKKLCAKRVEIAEA